MEDMKILNSGENFLEFPEAYIKIDQKSNYVYMIIDDNTYIAREKVENIITDRDMAIYIINYYNIEDGSNLLSLKYKKSLTNRKLANELPEGVSIKLLSNILNIKSNNVYYLNIVDIMNLKNEKRKMLSK